MAKLTEEQKAQKAAEKAAAKEKADAERAAKEAQQQKEEADRAAANAAKQDEQAKEAEEKAKKEAEEAKAAKEAAEAKREADLKERRKAAQAEGCVLVKPLVNMSYGVGQSMDMNDEFHHLPKEQYERLKKDARGPFFKEL